MIKFNSSIFFQTTLGELVSKEKKSIISGPFGSNIGKIFFKKEGIPVIRGNNLSTGEEKFKDSGFVFITREKADELNCYAIKNDLIFTAVGTIGQVGIIDENLKYDKYVISNKQLRVRFDKEKVTPLFAYYWFSSNWIQKLILQRNVGSTVPLINLSVLKGLPIILPKSIKLQNSIVEILENITAKIELNNKINQELEAMAKTLYDYWFVQFDFPDVNRKPYKSSGGQMVFNEELKREIPDGWAVKDLKDVERNIITGKTPSTKIEANFNGDIPFITIDDIRQNRYIIQTERTLTKLGADTQLNKFLYENDICVSCIGTVGVIGFVGKTSQSNQQINSISKPKDYNRYYLFQYLMDYFLFNTGAKKGAVLSNMNKNEFESIRIIDGPTYLKQEYFKTIDSGFKRIFNNIKENQKLSELRDWLLPMLMNGQVTVGEGYDESEVDLGMVAESPASYNKDKTLEDLFPESNLYAEVACLLAIEKEMNSISRGKTWVQKTANHLKEIKKEPKLKNVPFEEYYWGMFSTTIAQSIDNNPFLVKESNGGATVYKLRSNKIAEIKKWMQEPCNSSFVESARAIVSLYNHPLILNNLERIELLNTVYRCMQKLGASDFNSIYQAMREWPMQEQGYANKAEKFKPEETRHMILFIKDEILE
jgi:type I restriction enzyme S subunit